MNHTDFLYSTQKPIENQTLEKEILRNLLSRFEGRISNDFDPFISENIDFLVSTLEELHR